MYMYILILVQINSEVEITYSSETDNHELHAIVGQAASQPLAEEHDAFSCRLEVERGRV